MLRFGEAAGAAHTPPVRVLVALIFLQTLAEVLPDVVSGIPWTQPQAMEYGGVVFIAVVLWVFLVRRSPRGER
jgi:protein-S-isoprenylcysteine O-methyltransferase Ste14